MSLTINDLQKEALRIAQVETDLIKEMASLNFFGDDKEQSHEQQLNQVKNEIKKLENLELILAVVGTMKAGKSTVINAIVGTEILPSRNMPMTTLPTKIKHTPHQKNPVLTLTNQNITHLKKTIKQVTDWYQDNADKVTDENDKELFSKILNKNNTIKEKYNGAKELCDFLYVFNDLVRITDHITKEYKVHFSYEKYNDMSSIPLIEVEFTHLKGAEDGEGTLILLDTPGMNEAGRENYLEEILDGQLKNSAGVLLVLDFTTINSTSEEKIRNNILKFADDYRDRLQILINKFDQKDHYAGSADDMKNLVAHYLMEKKIKPTQVFPGSARHAYLSNRVKNELILHNKLPEIEQNPWIEDFGNEAFATLWGGLVTPDKLDFIREGAKALWEKSGFEDLLRISLETLLKNASSHVLDSATTILKRIISKLNLKLATRRSGLNTSIENLQKTIKELEDFGSKIKKIKDEALEASQKLFTEFEKLSSNSLTKAEKSFQKDLELIFKEGKAISEKSNAKLHGSKTKAKTKNKSGTGDLTTMQLEQPQAYGQDKTEKIFDSKEEKLEFKVDDTEQMYKLKEITTKIDKSIRAIYSNIEHELQIDFENAYNDFEKKFEKEIHNTILELIDEIEKKLTDELTGFSEKQRKTFFFIKRSEQFKLNFQLFEQDWFKNFITEEKNQKTGTRYQRNLWGTLCYKLDLDVAFGWGYESYTYTENLYVINFKDIRNNITSITKKLFENLANNTIEQKIKNPLNSNIKNYFYDFEVIVQDIQEDLEQCILDKNKNADEQKLFAQQITLLEKKSAKTEEDIEDLHKIIQKKMGDING
ncbi:dynamin family protein [Desulfococcaceae bacterium OttesenSCG-928-F15]|nr:dynamin family protein [Desulfococcaceae bacterium OttesenSCG-928-F15]